MVGKKYNFDLIVIGSGLAGRTIATTCAREGMRVAVVEDGEFGGDEINRGGIGLGSLLEMSQAYHTVADGTAWGVGGEGTRLNYVMLHDHAMLTVDDAREKALKEFGELEIELIAGTAKLVNDHEVNVGEEIISAKYIALCTGAVLKENKVEGLADAGCLDVGGVVTLRKQPRTVFVVGAGSTGCEIAQYFAGIGCRVLLADISGRLLPREDEEVGQVLDKVLNDEKVAVLTQTRVTAVERDSVSRRVMFVRAGVEHAVRVDEIVIATGETAMVYELGLDNAGVAYDKDGVKHDTTMRTNRRNIYVAGGCAKGGDNTSLKAFNEGQVAARAILGDKKVAVDKLDIRVTRTIPMVVQIGMNEDDCMKEDMHVRKVVVALANAKAFHPPIYMQEGFVKMIFSGKQNAIVGTTLMGDGAREGANTVLGLMKSNVIDPMTLVQMGLWGDVIREALKK